MRSAWGIALPVIVALVGHTTAVRSETLWEELSIFERERVDEALDELGLQRDPNPDGKRFGRVIVYTDDVFEEDDIINLTWLNRLHATTRAEVVLDEVVWSEGSTYEVGPVWETVRQLRRRSPLSVVALVPILSDQPDEVVDILAVTSDRWSLRLSVTFDLTNFRFDRLRVFAGEDNLAGWHRSLGLLFELEPDTLGPGLLFADPRLARTRVSVLQDVTLLFNRHRADFEGSRNRSELLVGVERSVDRAGFRLQETHAIEIDRRYRGSQLRTYDDPDTPDVEEVPFVIDQTEIDVLGELLLATGGPLRHIWSVGAGWREQQYALARRDGVSDEAAAAFTEDVLPVNERSIFLTASYRWLYEDWALARNLQTYAFTEFIRRGPELIARLSYAPQAFGSDSDQLDASLFTGYSTLSARWLARTGLGLRGRYSLETGDAWSDRTVLGRAHLATPPFGPFRLHAGGRVRLVFERRFEGPQELGSTTGLRGFREGAFLGDSTVLGQIELRTRPLRLFETFFGVLAFADVATGFSDGSNEMPVFADAGIGLRSVGRTSRGIAFRADWGIPLTGQEDAFPGTFVVGIEQLLGVSNLDYSWFDALETWEESGFR